MLIEFVLLLQEYILSLDAAILPFRRSELLVDPVANPFCGTALSTACFLHRESCL